MSENAIASSLEPAAVPLRPPEQVMRLARLGSFHQSRLSFLRVLLRRIDRERWRFQRRRFDVDAKGVGAALYTIEVGGRTYTLVAFAHDLAPDKRTDRVIATEWDATFALFDGIPADEEMARLRENVPRQEGGRYLQSELVLARANRSVRLFDSVVAALAAGRQPDETALRATGYLMRTTAVYANGKFGIADRDVYAGRDEMAGPFQAEMLTVWLIRSFTVDLVEHLARLRNPHSAVRLDRPLRRRLGVGNATGLGMAPFLVKHPALIHRWIVARETALARVRSACEASYHELHALRGLVQAALEMHAGWTTDDPVQAPRIAQLRSDLVRFREEVGRWRDQCGRRAPGVWNALYVWAEQHLCLEAQEQVVSLLLETFPRLVDDLAATMAIDEQMEFAVDGRMRCDALRAAVDQHYAWTRAVDFAQPAANAKFWYVSEEKLEPRLGERHTEPGAELEQPLTIARDVVALRSALGATTADTTVGRFLMQRPEHRHTVRRVQTSMRNPYAEIRDNLISAELRAIDLLRCKLSFFGCTRFDPRSDKWLRITLYQGAPFPDEIGCGDWDQWIWD